MENSSHTQNLCDLFNGLGIRLSKMIYRAPGAVLALLILAWCLLMAFIGAALARHEVATTSSAVASVEANEISMRIDALERQAKQELPALENRLASLEQQTNDLQWQIEQQTRDLQREVASLTGMLNLNAEGSVPLGSRNTYQSLGAFWQVKGLILMADPQGCRVNGEILYRLSEPRRNVEVSVQLLNAKRDTIAEGSGVLTQATPGRYEPFSILIRTDAQLSDMTSVRLKLDEDSGTDAQF